METLMDVLVMLYPYINLNIKYLVNINNMEKHFKVLDKHNSNKETNAESLDHQDWNEIIVRTKKSKEEERKKSSKKLSDKQLKELKLIKKDEEGNLKHDKVSQDIRKQIQGRRCELKWTQKELAQKCNFQVTIINDIETGKANYNPQHINKIKRVLKL